MYHNDWVALQLAREREHDLVRKLEHQRLIKLAEASNHDRGHRLYHVLDWVGRQLVRWGERLQARHAMYHRQSLTVSQEVHHG